MHISSPLRQLQLQRRRHRNWALVANKLCCFSLSLPVPECNLGLTVCINFHSNSICKRRWRRRITSCPPTTTMYTLLLLLLLLFGDVPFIKFNLELMLNTRPDAAHSTVFLFSFSSLLLLVDGSGVVARHVSPLSFSNPRGICLSRRRRLRLHPFPRQHHTTPGPSHRTAKVNTIESVGAISAQQNTYFSFVHTTTTYCWLHRSSRPSATYRWSFLLLPLRASSIFI